MHDTQAHDKETTADNWRTPGTSVSGHYNTPPLREDLVPRSRMAPEGKQKRKRRGKLSCFSDKRVKPKNLARLNKFEKKKYHEGELGRKHYVRNEGQEHLRKTLRLKGKIYIETTLVKTR